MYFRNVYNTTHCQRCFTLTLTEETLASEESGNATHIHAEQELT
jgi:hypothetical protein